ncbi:MAG: toxin secretion/phage lysis holin, partial [Lacrimispora sp.]|nr:toxin secretion/phage lysis holin [Lacrimispora sp.]
MEKIIDLLALAWGSPIIKLVILAVVMDTCFGCIRAIKEHKFNSCFGIDGAIRKISM